jgi:uncharacterized OB-fold protein
MTVHTDFPLPEVTWPPLKPFWDGAANHELVLPSCDVCGRLNWYPSEHCRSCGASGRIWTKLSGRGTLFSWAVVHHAWIPAYRSLLPFVTGLVSLVEDERVRIPTLIVDSNVASLRPDMPVRATFRPLSFPPSTKAVTVPMFASLQRTSHQLR